MMKQLPIPEAAIDDDTSIEMMRAWIARKRLHISLNIGVYEGKGVSEAKAWGIILADAARHIASALAQGHGADASEALLTIREHFDDELSDPSSQVTGHFVRKQ
jgi:hypothetical protein